MLKRIICGVLLVAFSSNLYAAEGVFIDTSLAPKGTIEQPLVKSIPSKYKSELGANYVLVRADFLDYLDKETDKASYYSTEIVPGMLKELEEQKLYSSKLRTMLEDSYAHMDTLNKHIDAQEAVIEDLSPTWFQKNSLWIGILTGVFITGAAAYGASSLN